MKRYKKDCIIIAFLGLYAQVFSGCGSTDNWNGLNTYRVEKAEQLTEDPEEREDDNFSILSEIGKREMDVKVDMHFLTTGNTANEKVCKLINSHLIELLLKQSSELSVDEAVAQYIEDVKGEFRNDEISNIYYDHLTGRVEYGAENIINYRLVEETFTGGAHPCTMTTLLRFDAQTGDFITVDGIFPSYKQSELKDLLLEKLMAANNVSTLEGLQQKGILQMTDLFISPNFALRADSVEFYYNEYDIAPYAYGPTTICLSYDEVRPFLAVPNE